MGVYVPVVDIAGKASRADSLQSTDANPPVIKNSSGVEVGQTCRAWVNINGASGASPVVRSSFNVSSVTRNATGHYTIALANALPDTNYCAVVSTGRLSSSSQDIRANLADGALDFTTSSLAIKTYAVASSTTAADGTPINVAIFR